MKTDIILRCHNDLPLLAETLAGVSRQTMPYRLIVLDNESTDGSRETAAEHADVLIDIPAGSYVPGRVLNQGMAEAASEFVAFLNSDCTPVNEHWLAGLLAGFAPGVGAVFGRQSPRPDCWPLFAKDTNDTFGDGRRQAAWLHCFSMASSAIRRQVWEEVPFDPDLQYSEDIDWTWRIRQLGHEIRYVPDAEVLHSHNYTLRQFHRRQYGEGRAEARIFPWTAWDSSFLRYSCLPALRKVLADWKYCLPRGHFASLCHSPGLRLAQMLGRRRGFSAGRQGVNQ